MRVVVYEDKAGRERLQTVTLIWHVCCDDSFVLRNDYTIILAYGSTDNIE